MHQNNQLQFSILSNFSNIVTIRLDDTNYVSWRFMMESMLIGCDLMGYIDGSVPCPPQYKTTTEAGITELTEEYKEWRKNDSALITLLAATLSSNALSFIVGSRSSKEVWLSLEERYGKLPKYKAYELKISMQQIQKGNDNVDKYMERFKTIRDRLSVAGVFISDEDITYLVLHGLPSEYATMKTIIRMKTLSSSVSMAELRSLLLIAEYEIEQTVKSILERSKTEMVVHGDSFRSENFVVQGTQFGGAGLPKGMYDASGSSYSSSTAQAGHAPSSAMNGNAYRPPASSGSQNGYVPTSTTMAVNTGFVNSSIVPQFDINSTLQPLRHHQLVTQMGVSPHANFMSQAASYVKAFNTMDSNGSLSPSTNFGPRMQSNEPTTLNHSFSPSSSGSMSIHPHTNGISPANGSFFSQKNRSSIVVCYFCGKRGHCAYRCGYRKSQLLNFPSSSFIECQICKRKGHSAKSCYYIQPQVMANSFSSPPGLWNSLSYIVNVYSQEHESGAAFWPDVHGRIVCALIISQLLLLGLLSTKRAALATPFLLVLPVSTIVFYKYCADRFEPAFVRYPLQEAKMKDDLEHARDPDLNVRDYLQSAYVHPVFKVCDEDDEDKEHYSIV